MERGIDNSKISIFNYMKNSKIHSYSKLSPVTIIKIRKNNDDNSDIIKLEKNIQSLQSQIILPNANITNTISAIEFAIAPGNNNLNHESHLFPLRLFIDIINCLETSLPAHEEKVLSLIEKCLSIKSLSRYIVKNQQFIERVLTYLYHNTMYETAIMIFESLLMNHSSIVQFELFNNHMSAAYKFMLGKSRLDYFCRLLVILIFDYPKYEFKQIFLSKDRLKFKSLTKTTAENQVYCLHYNNFFENIMMTLRHKIELTKKLANDKLSISQMFNLLRSQTDMRTFANQQKDYKPKTSKIFTEGITINNNNKSKTGNKTITGNKYNKATFKSLSLKPNTKITNEELLSLLHLNVFSLFRPKYISQNFTNAQNVYNTYHQIVKTLKKFGGESKIKQNKKDYITLMKYKTYQIEMIFVLSTFLGSKRKIEIQNKLSSLDLIDLLLSYFDYIDWGNIFEDNKRPSFIDEEANRRDENVYHGNGCNCDSDSPLKIQYLRLIYSYCSLDNINLKNKLKLFSDSDLLVFLQGGYMKQILFNMIDNQNRYVNSNAKVTYKKCFNVILNKLNIITTKDNDYNKNQSFSTEEILLSMISSNDISRILQRLCDKDADVGLLNKLILKYIQECYYSSAKFWLASTLEVILRGNNTFFQTYIATSGIIPCILYDILYSKEDKNQVIQLSFDMLGEIIKFNKGNFYIIEYYLFDSNEYSEFNRKAVSKESLIDSNVFIRALILSKYSFDKIDQKDIVPIDKYFSARCKLFKLIDDEKLHEIFLMLISIVKPNDINQTNISCINSALIILIVEYLKGTLEEFMTELGRRYKDEIGIQFNNFKTLVKMWKYFYNYRTKDSISLQHSTTLPFDIWHQVIHLLLSEDITSPTSLSHY